MNREELALEIFGIHAEHELVTLEEEKELCREIADWHLAKVAQLEERVRELETALKFFGHHKPGCNTELSAYEIGESGAAPWCTCGLGQALGGS